MLVFLESELAGRDWFAGAEMTAADIQMSFPLEGAAARGGLWARAESTPFGHGRPFTRRQMERLVREAGLEPTAWSATLFAPPWPPLFPLADGWDQVARRLAPGSAGVILLEAGRRAYAPVRPGLAEQAVAALGDLAPQPVPVSTGLTQTRLVSETERP